MTTPSSSRAAEWAGNAIAFVLLGLIGLFFLRLNGGDWWLAMPHAERWWMAAAMLALYLGFCGWIWWRSRPRDTNAAIAAMSASADAPPILVIHASQTGFASELAERTAQALAQAGKPAVSIAIDRIDAGRLAAGGRMLFIASTTGEGDPPDPALGFVRNVMVQAVRLETLEYGVLALGDREYDDFCAFGHHLDQWLRQHGAHPLFDIVEVDNADESALRHWQYHLGQLGGSTDLPDWITPRYESWQLSTRDELNPGSVGGSVFHLSLLPPAGTSPQWQAGDIAEIGPRNAPAAVSALLKIIQLDADAAVEHAGKPARLGDVMARSHLPEITELAGLGAQAVVDTLRPLPHREYSIASLPSEGNLQILLRRMLRPDGTPGIGSGWLCDHAPLQGPMELRIRANPNFHPPVHSRPLILIGNGTGIAGLRAHLKARVDAGARRNWLLFGERNADRDFFFRDEIVGWQADGFIERLDLAFSRDQDARVYVQHRVQASATTLREWVDSGAVILVCGSLAGMAPGVDTALRSALGDEKIEQMLIDGHYRRDVY